MSTLSPQAITILIDQARRGDQGALNRLLPEVYGELRRIAGRSMRRERPGQTLQATALVHETCLRLFRDAALSFQNRADFLAIAAQSMREILVNHARGRHAAKHGGTHRRAAVLRRPDQRGDCRGGGPVDGDGQGAQERRAPGCTAS